MIMTPMVVPSNRSRGEMLYNLILAATTINGLKRCNPRLIKMVSRLINSSRGSGRTMSTGVSKTKIVATKSWTQIVTTLVVMISRTRRGSGLTKATDLSGAANLTFRRRLLRKASSQISPKYEVKGLKLSITSLMAAALSQRTLRIPTPSSELARSNTAQSEALTTSTRAKIE